MLKRYLFVFFLFGWCGCSVINPSLMFKTPKNYKFNIPKDDSQPDYKIAPYDILEFKIFTNEGYKLIDLISSSTSSSANSTLISTEYSVDKDGNVKLPVLGNVMIKDYTRIEAEKMLEEKYTAFYNKPFIKLKVVNRRVFVFNGTGSQGAVVTLTNEKTTIIEALAKVGGITTTGKAFRIKLIRGDLKNPDVQLIDLSTLDGMKRSNLLVEANDIIYIEPVKRLSQEILAQISPILSLLNTVLILYIYSRSFTK
jgi:polysaccharide export outer membrane protein